MSTKRVLCALSMLPLFAAVGIAQTVRGLVVDRGDVPVPGVVVHLIDSASGVSARALSNDRGEFRVVGGRPGSYRLRTLRIGYVSFTSAPIVLRLGEESTQRLVLSNVQLLLDTIRVTSRNSCRAFADSGAATFAVWEQVRAALTATQLTASERAVSATTVAYERTLDPLGRRVIRQTMVVSSDYVRQPWKTIAPDVLRRLGFVVTTPDNTTVYYAPGLDMLLSPGFVEDHCFRLTSDRDRLGILFEPAPDRRKVSEIRGTMWLDRKTAELRSLEYRYANIPIEQETEARGDMEFVRLRNGAWAITRWAIRMPILETRTGTQAFGGMSTRATGIQSTGGELVLVRRAADTLWSRAPLVMAGIVLDSATNKESAGATVTLSGTGLSAVSDTRGRFSMNGVLPGEYTAEVRTPSLDSISAVYQVPLSFVDAGMRAEIRVPTATQFQATVCGGKRLDASGIILGTVQLPPDGSSSGAVTVVAEWTDLALRGGEASIAVEQQRRRLEARPDPRGVFRLCGVPVATKLTIRASSSGASGDPTVVEIPPHGRFARVSLSATPSPSRLAALMGLVLVDSTKQPIAGAEVFLPDLAKTVLTDDRGSFRVSDIPPGEYSLKVRRVGFGPLDARVTVAPGQPGEQRIYLSRVVMLDSVVVNEAETNPWLKEFDDNRKAGLGQFFTRADLEKRQAQSLDGIISELRGTVLIRAVGGTAYVATKRQVNFCPPKDIACMKGERLVFIPGEAMSSYPGAAVACYAQVYLDRMLLNPDHPAEPVDLRRFTASQIEAMEYYDGVTATPARYSRRGSECGVLVIHTRRSP